jgi:hypothetical protein
MKRNVRWMLPVTAAVGLLVGMSAMSARAADDDAKPSGKGNISGTVVDKDGKGVAGVEVHLMKPMMRRGGGAGAGGGAGHRRPPAAEDQAARVGARAGAVGLQDKPGAGEGRPPRPEPVATATTDDSGKFEMKDVPAGDYMIGVRDTEKKVFGGARVTVKDGETATVEIKTSDKPMFRGGPGGRGGHRGPGGAGGAGGGEEK